jgi:hypothetical protein
MLKIIPRVHDDGDILRGQNAGNAVGQLGPAHTTCQNHNLHLNSLIFLLNG